MRAWQTGLQYPLKQRHNIYGDNAFVRFYVISSINSLNLANKLQPSIWYKGHHHNQKSLFSRCSSISHLQVFVRVLFKRFFATSCAEVVGFSHVFCLEFSCFLVHFHPANRIFRHTFSPLFNLNIEATTFPSFDILDEHVSFLTGLHWLPPLPSL